VVEKGRHGCLTAWLVFMIIVNSGTALYYLASGQSVRQLNPAMPDWALPVLILGCVLNVVFAVALFQWKKWGFYGFVCVAVVAMMVNFASGLGPFALTGLVGIAVLYAVLRIGGERNAWDNLD